MNVPNSIDINIKATHYDFINHNAVKYTPNAINKGSDSWTSPFKKPQLLAHDKNRDPIGRIIDYQIIDNDPSDPVGKYVLLTARITDKSSIEKILDGRYNTVSVGSRTNRVICSECGQIITEDGLCEHEKGSQNDRGELIYWLIDQISYVENSFVNDPADPYAGIHEIDVGMGFMPYNDFLDNRNEILNEMNMEDNFMKDKKLTYKERQNLPDSDFSYVAEKDGEKIRKFPCHDEAHVRNALARLPQAKGLSKETKDKIKACILRKAKKYDINVSKDELEENPNILTYRIHDNYSEDEINAVDKLFKENPDFDQICDNSNDDNDNDDDPGVNIDDLKKPELLAHAKKLQENLDNLEEEKRKAIKTRDEKIKSLEAEVEDNKTLIYEKDNEINKYLDENAILESKVRSSIVDNIVDLIGTKDKESRDNLVEKYQKRLTDSLNDTLEDLRDQKMNNISEDREDDDTLNADENSDTNQNDGSILDMDRDDI